MNRLFTFGCSFTNYHWPTWADIIGKEYSSFQNWGKTGGGNSFIFYSLMECIAREKITKEDTVMIMWTSIGREDRYIRNKGWLTPGSIYNQSYYDDNFVTKYADPTGYLLRDLAHISASRAILESIGCQYYFLSTVPLSIYDDNTDDEFDIDSKMLNLYKDDISCIHKSVYEVVFNKDWYSKVGVIVPKEIEEEYEKLKGTSWPSWEKFLIGEWGNVTSKVKQELLPLHKKLNIRTDTHPVPQEYLEYILKTLPIKLSQSTLNWVSQINQDVVANKQVRFTKNNPNRF